MKNTFLYTIIFTFLVCFLFVIFLSFTNAATIDKIQSNKEIAEQKAILQVLGAPQVATKQEVLSQFSQIEIVTINERTYFSGNFEEKPAIATAFEGPGLWGTIYGYIALSPDMSKILGFTVTDQNETPGLGGRISEDWFQNQFNGETLINDSIVIKKGGTGDSDYTNGSVDGITGATRTSDSIQAILDTYIDIFKKDIGG